MADEQAFPSFFRPLLESSYGAADVERILAGSRGGRLVTLRANGLRATAAQVAAQLDQAGIAWQSVPWYGDAFVLPQAREDAVRELSAYGEGQLYLQNLSAMIPPLVLGDAAGLDVCDLCAAPGGKTTQIMALSGGRAMVMACERSVPRAQRLRFNLERQGAGNVTVMEYDARQLDPFFSFDRILLDAPCSGSGTLQQADPKLAKRFTRELVSRSVKAQRSLLAKGLSLLRPGGVLVYSTCSVLPQENEEVVSWALGQAGRQGTFELEPVNVPGLDEAARLPVTLDGCLGICPDQRYEGFFVARIKRTA